MLIAYGVACLVALALSALHRPAAPYALALALSWLLGFVPYEAWWMISLAQGAVFTALLKWDSPLWARLIACCTPIMLLCDAAFWTLKVNNHHFSTPYEVALNVLLGVQLLAVAWPGGSRLVRYFGGAYRTFVTGWRGSSGLGHPTRRRAAAARVGGAGRNLARSVLIWYR